MKKLDFFQIYYDDIQKGELYPFAQPYKNYGITPFFENSIISELVPASSADLISVCSWRLKQKRSIDKGGPVPIVLKGDITLSEEKILSHDFDVAILTPRSSSHKMLAMARQWHGKVWDNAFVQLKIFLRVDLDMRVPEEVSYPVYENHFIATRNIYQDYVNNVLIPTMRFIEDYTRQTGDKSVFMAPSGYSKRKRANPEEVGRIKQFLGFEEWPILPFILERLFSIYINDKRLKIINL